MNWKRYGRKRSWPNFKVLPRNLHGETEKQKNLSHDSLYPRSEPGTSRIRRTCANYKWPLELPLIGAWGIWSSALKASNSLTSFLLLPRPSVLASAKFTASCIKSLYKLTRFPFLSLHGTSYCTTWGSNDLLTREGVGEDVWANCLLPIHQENTELVTWNFVNQCT
jgi:hypothetical protein